MNELFAYKEVTIHSRDYWFIVASFLQQNWALIDENQDGTVTVFFIGDTSGVFDRMMFESKEQAISDLQKNLFVRYEEYESAHEIIFPPRPPFYKCEHPSGPIYSSGEFWEDE